ncbi:hypothetical protein QFC22_002400 [Naganishia vaughanmartiniae]|uniref:Uncharacterized protein n=1 Tax=Naganishia vaughanmartiniae TaxID=1424756 RepID=A0ACC2XCK5_9TREE|nr:hypothetical protein QFC22_002400 [Naganishia vaughanmartiniae]
MAVTVTPSRGASATREGDFDVEQYEKEMTGPLAASADETISAVFAYHISSFQDIRFITPSNRFCLSEHYASTGRFLIDTFSGDLTSSHTLPHPFWTKISLWMLVVCLLGKAKGIDNVEETFSVHTIDSSSSVKILDSYLTSGWKYCRYLRYKLVRPSRAFHRLLFYNAVLARWRGEFVTLLGQDAKTLRKEIRRQDASLRNQQLQIDSLIRKTSISEERYQQHEKVIARASSQMLGFPGNLSNMTPNPDAIRKLEQRLESAHADFRDQKQMIASLEKDVRCLQPRKDWMSGFSNQDRVGHLAQSVTTNPTACEKEEATVPPSIEETAARLKEQISIYERYMIDSICTMEKQLAAQQAVLDENRHKLQNLYTLAATKSADPPEAHLGAEEIKELLEKKFKAVVIQSKNKFDIYEARMAALEDVYKPVQQTLTVENRLENLEYDVGNTVGQLEGLTIQTGETADSISALPDRVDNLRLDIKNVIKKATEATDPEALASLSRDTELLHGRIENLERHHKSALTKTLAGSFAALDHSVKQSRLNVSVNYLGLKQQVDWLKDDVHTLDMHVAERLQLIDIFLSQVERTPAERLLLVPAYTADGTPDLKDGTLFPRPTTASSDSVGETHRTTQVNPPAPLPNNQRLPAADTVQAEESTSVLRSTTSSDLRGMIFESLQGDVGGLTARYLAVKNTFKAASSAWSSIGRKGSAETGGDRLELTNTSSTDQSQNSLGSSTGEAAILNDHHRDEGLGQHLRPEPSIGNSSQRYLESAAALSLSSPSTASSQLSPMSTTSDELPANALFTVTVNEHGTSLRLPLTVQQQVRPSIDKHQTLSLEDFERFKEEIEERLTALKDNLRSNYGTQAAFITDIPAFDLHPAPPEPNVFLAKTMVQALKALMTGLQNTVFRTTSRVVLHENRVKQLLDETEALLKYNFGATSIAQTATQTNAQNLKTSISNINWRLYNL